MNKHLKILIALLSSIFALAACGQNNSAGTTAETTQTAQETTTAPTTQVASNKQNTTEALPKDGVQRFKRIDKGDQHFLSTTSRMTSSINRWVFTFITLKD